MTARFPEIAAGGRLAQNVMHFGRALRAAGLPVGPGKVLDAIRAVETAGIERRDDFYWSLHAVFVNRRDQRDVFDQAFHVFWRNPELLEKMLSMMLPTVRPEVPSDLDELSQRVADALGMTRDTEGDDRQRTEEIELDMAMTFSDREVLQEMDFESMSADEIARAKKAVAAMRLDIRPLATRRLRPDSSGDRIDMRATMRETLRAPGGIISLERRRRRTRPAALVLLCDISGSMSAYSQMLVHFARALTNDRDRVFTFVFGTRLTNITRHLRHRDVEVAMAQISGAVDDWSGGTRIGACLHAFNRDWSRRVLAQGAVVVLMTDGLDRDMGDNLDNEIKRLHMSARRLIWLNPLLRYEGFEPKSWGVRAMLPHVDEFRSAHSLASLEDLADLLSGAAATRGQEIEIWRQAI
jgi:uncharacterized protein with von Willebrand factor type A (vWA) domain